MYSKNYLLQNRSIIAVLLIVFTSIYCPLVMFPKLTHTIVHSISFVAPLQCSKQYSSSNIDFACVDSRNAQAHNKLFQCQKIKLNYLRRTVDRRYFCKSRRYLGTNSKKSFIEIWQNSSEIMPTFAKLPFIQYPTQISESFFQVPQQFVLSLGISTINVCKMNVARRNLLLKKK